ncbi:MAG TPA: MopE-related protein [Patescibacteria group bacterium]|nr:MopE-related protein [Patescibacteria group bacterium]
MKKIWSIVLLIMSALLMSGISDCQQDGDGDGYTKDDGDCDDGNPSIYPGAIEICDHVDNDCDGVKDEDLDADGDGATSCSGDCDDTDPAKGPEAGDPPDGIDNDCDKFVDDAGWEWGSEETDTVAALAVEGTLVCVAGETWGDLYQLSAGGSDAMAACFDTDGTPRLEWQFGTASADSFSDITLMDGEVFVSGTVDEAAFVGSPTWSGFGIPGSSGNAVVVDEGFVYLAGREPNGAGGDRAFVTRYGIDGTPAGKWVLEKGTKSSATGLAKRAGGIVVIGHTDETVYGRIDGWVANLTTNLDLEGNVEVFGTSQDDFPHALVIDADGSSIIVGNTYTENSYAEGFVTKLGIGGWFVLTGFERDDFFHGVITGSDDVHIIGSHYDDLLLSQIVVEHRRTTDGTLLEEKVFGTPNDNDYGYGIGIDAGGRIWIAGYTGGDLFDPLPEGDKTTDCYISPL